MAAFLKDDLTSCLFTSLWPLVVIWVYKMVDSSRIEQRRLCRSQINIKIERVSQTIDRKRSFDCILHILVQVEICLQGEAYCSLHGLLITILVEDQCLKLSFLIFEHQWLI